RGDGGVAEQDAAVGHLKYAGGLADGHFFPAARAGGDVAEDGDRPEVTTEDLELAGGAQRIQRRAGAAATGAPVVATLVAAVTGGPVVTVVAPLVGFGFGFRARRAPGGEVDVEVAYAAEARLSRLGEDVSLGHLLEIHVAQER